MILLRTLLVFALLAAFPARPLWAQSRGDFFADRFSIADIGKMKTRFDYAAELYPQQDVAGQNKGLSMTRHRAGVSAPIVQDQTREWSASASVNVQDVRTDAVLPDSGKRIPGGLWDVRFGTQYRRMLDNGWLAGGFLSVGSASDRPFAGYDETTISATAFTRIAHKDRNAWLFFLSYANNRDFLNHVPLPGFGYLYVPSDKVRILAGFPFFSLHAGPYAGYSLEAVYLPIRDALVKISRGVGKGVRVYTAFQSRHDAYYLADRSDKDQRLFYYEMKAGAGVEISQGEHWKIDLSGGYAFDRFYFQGERYSDRSHDRVNVGDTPYLSARVSYSF